VGRKTRGMEQLGVLDSLAVGCAQVLALIPGASRSGSTIMGGLFVGEKRETAARFSFLLSIPAVGASGLLELKEAIHSLPEGSGLSLVLATIVSGIVGYASIWFLLRFLRTHSTAIFIGYRLFVGVLIIMMLAAGYLSPQIEAADPTAPPAATSPIGIPAITEQQNTNTANNNQKDSVNSKREKKGPGNRKSR
ncbi:MAG: hypothetical protein JO360_06110, partial [Acidobacteria bacterium]|nr:hypothetical protein [Acidobacteriota bacterium]